jgi:hypothetical protein
MVFKITRLSCSKIFEQVTHQDLNIFFGRKYDPTEIEGKYETAYPQEAGNHSDIEIPYLLYFFDIKIYKNNNGDYQDDRDKKGFETKHKTVSFK